MREKQNTLWNISGYYYEPEYLFPKIFFFSVKTEMLLYKQVLFVWILCKCDFPGASQYCLFVYRQKSWAFSEWKRMVDKINSACFEKQNKTSL